VREPVGPEEPPLELSMTGDKLIRALGVAVVLLKLIFRVCIWIFPRSWS
jgi:hypothetical protein